MPRRERRIGRQSTLSIDGKLTVSRLGLGTNRITGEGFWGPPARPNDAIAVLQRAVQLGVELIDTADCYGPAITEELIAAALYPYPAGLLIATKAGLERPGPGRWTCNGRPEHLRAACEASMRRLRTDHIQLYQLHEPDPAVPFEDSVGTLAALRAEGKIGHVGLCNVSVEQLERARAIVDVVTVQNRFNLADQSLVDVLDRCERDGLGFIPWFPLGAGALTRSGGVVAAIASRYGATPSQIALAWLLQRSRVMLPIPGTSSIQHLTENIAATRVRLDDVALKELEAAWRNPLS